MKSTEIEEEMISHLGELPNERKKRKWLIACLFFSIVIIMVGIIYGGVRLIPIQTKIVGTWISEDDSSKKLVISEHEATLRLENIQGKTGYTSLFVADLYGRGSNKYVGERVKAYLVIQRSQLTDEAYQEIIKEKKSFSVVAETKKEITLAYSEKTIKEMYFETNGIEHFFNLTLTNFKGLKGQSLILKNLHFAENGETFKREKNTEIE